MTTTEANRVAISVFEIVGLAGIGVGSWALWGAAGFALCVGVAALLIAAMSRLITAIRGG